MSKSDWYIQGEKISLGATQMSAKDWSQGKGPRGGTFWTNSKTGERRYQRENPGSEDKPTAKDESATQRPKQQKARPSEEPSRRMVSQQEMQQAREADSKIVEPKSPEEWPQFMKSVEQHPYFQKVNSLLGALEKQTESGDVRMWSKERNQSGGEYTPERKALHDQIVKKMLNPNAKAKDGEKPKVMFLIGPPGAGKTSVGQPIVNKMGVEFTTINADDVKEQFPEYQGWNAACVHEESSDVAEGKLFSAALNQNHNVLFDLTGASGKKMKALADKMAKHGYDLHMVHVSVPSYKTSHRAWKRFRNNAFNESSEESPGRFVPPAYVHIAVDGNPDNTYEELKKHPAMKSWSKYDNDVAQGSPAKRLDEGSR
jgi:adenylate kinase family enzyme